MLCSATKQIVIILPFHFLTSACVGQNQEDAMVAWHRFWGDYFTIGALSWINKTEKGVCLAEHALTSR